MSAAEQIHTINQMETAKSSLGVFTLPCGYLNLETQELVTEVELREITGREEDMLASAQIPSEKKMSALLMGCVVRIGSETNRDKLAAMIQDLPLGDRVFLIFAIRRVTLGDEIPIRETCPDTQCKVTSLFTLNLATDFETKAMADPHRRIFDFTLPSGKSARIRVSTGKDEENLSKLVKRKDRMDSLSQAILMRLELLGGEKPTLDAVQALGLRDRSFLRDKFTEVEGGIDTTIELVCPACGHEWQKDFDLGSSGFFSLGGRRRR